MRRGTRRRRHLHLHSIVVLFLVKGLFFHNRAATAWKLKSDVSHISTPVASTTTSTTRGGIDKIPWQSNSDSTVQSSSSEISKYESIGIPTFSPKGRLHNVEAAVKASKLVTARSNTAIALRCRQGLVLLTTIPTSAFLNTTRIAETSVDVNDSGKMESNINMVNKTMGGTRKFSRSLFLFDAADTTSCSSSPLVTNALFRYGIACATGGNAVDGVVLRQYLLDTFEKVIDNAGCGLEPNSSFHHWRSVVVPKKIARDMADYFQVVTQDVPKVQGSPLLASSLLVVGQNEVWKIDPTGQFWQADVSVIGQDADGMEEALYEALIQKVQDKIQQGDDTKQPFPIDRGGRIRMVLESLSRDDAIELILGCLKSKLMQVRSKVWSSQEHSTLVPQVFWQAAHLEYSSSYLGDASDDPFQSRFVWPQVSMKQGSIALTNDSIQGDKSNR